MFVDSENQFQLGRGKMEPDTATLLLIEKLRDQRDRILRQLARIELELQEQITKAPVANSETFSSDAATQQRRSAPSTADRL